MFSIKDGLFIDDVIQKKHKHSPTILKTDRRTPAPPRGDAALW